MTDTTTETDTRVAAVGLAVLMLASALAFVPAAAAQSSTTTIEVTAMELPDGFAGADFNVSVDAPSTTTISDVSVSSQFPLNRTSIANDGASASVRLVDLQETVQPGASDVTLVTVTVETSGDASPSLTIASDANIDAEDGSAISVETLSVGGTDSGPLSFAGNQITDLDGDGKYEDIDGDGSFTFTDVIQFVFSLGKVDTTAETRALDFDGSGTVDFTDVIDLVFELQAR
jgi:PKD repeat protein